MRIVAGLVIFVFVHPASAGKPLRALWPVFESNEGQAPSGVDFVLRGADYTAALSVSGVSIRGHGSPLILTLSGGNRYAQPGADSLGNTETRYFKGSGRQHTFRTYGRVRYDGIYPGIDLVYYVSNNQLEYDFRVAARVNPDRIRLRFDGQDRLEIDSAGDLVVRCSGMVWTHRKPSVYQQLNGARKVIPGRYRLVGSEVGFEIGPYDRGQPLIIDPVLTYASYLGGSQSDMGYGIAVDAAGYSYVVGETWSADFPSLGGLQLGKGNRDVFVAKLSPDGSQLVFSAILGGSADDSGRAIAVDSAGYVYITGLTYSTDFPTTPGAFRTTASSQAEIFVAKLSPDAGSLVYATYLGGSADDIASGIALDGFGNAYIAGYTSSPNFPITSVALQRNYRGGIYDGFITKLNPGGTSLVYSTYLGGSGADNVQAIQVDTTGNAYLTGSTDSVDFPLQSPLQTVNAGNTDVFVAKLNANGSGLLFGSYLGGHGSDYGRGITFDGDGSIYVVGSTSSADFPISPSGAQSSLKGSYDTFLVKLNSTKHMTVCGSFLGGSGTEEAEGVALDRSGVIFVAGYTYSGDFPIRNAVQSTYSGGREGFMAVMDNTCGLTSSTYLGGGGDEQIATLAVDSGSRVSMTGFTTSADFPATPGAVDTRIQGSDAFVARISSPGMSLPSSTPLQFVPVTPCRVADTRNPAGSLGGPAIAAGTSRIFTIPNSNCGIPFTAAAYSLNVTVIPQHTLGYLTVWPSGSPMPLASTLNSLDGRVKANAGTIPAGNWGGISVYATDMTDIVLDVNGYWVAAPNPLGLAFYPLTPCRVADTRSLDSRMGGPSLTGGVPRILAILSSPCNVPGTAQAYSLNFTAVPYGPLGYLSAWAAGLPQPLVSTLNAGYGQITANAAIVPAGVGGAINVFASDNSDLVVDINGYYAPPGPGGLSLYALNFCRILDTRSLPGGLPISGTLAVNISGGPCSVPGGAQAYLFNATVIPVTSLGYLTLWAYGMPQPLGSTLNALDGAVTSNMAIVSTTNGAIDVYASNSTQLVLDILAYFAP